MGRAQYVPKGEGPQCSYNGSWLSNLRWWPLMSLPDNEDFCQCLSPLWCWDNDAKPADSQCFYCCPGQSRNEYIHEVLSRIEKVTSVTEEMPKVMLALAKSESRGSRIWIHHSHKGIQSHPASPAAIQMSTFQNSELWHAHNSFEKAFTVFLLNNRETEHNAPLCLHKTF